MRRAVGALSLLLALGLGLAARADAGESRGVWISPERLAALPTSGTAWENLRRAASRRVGKPNLSDKADPVNVQVLAKALVYARTREPQLRREVIDACLSAMGTERGGSTLSLGRELVSYVIAADLVGLPPEDDAVFREWLRKVRHQKLDGRTLISTHERRPNNWGTHAGASRIAVAAYLGDRDDLERAARVFRGWLGDRDAYDGFRYRGLSWQAHAEAPVGVNPLGAVKQGHSIDGVLPDDQRRGGDFSWPPPRENYVYGALQGALAQAVLLHAAGYRDVWDWEDRALLRAFRWLHDVAHFPAEGDDTWMPSLVNSVYGTDFPAPLPSKPGKNVGWTDWSHASSAKSCIGGAFRTGSSRRHSAPLP